jgi:hypothetical protein
MNIGMIIFIVILIVLIIIIIKSYVINNNILTKLTDAKIQQIIPKDSLATNSNTASSNYAYSIWFYINDWNYRYNDTKVIFCKQELSTPTTPNGTYPQPCVSLDAYNNNITTNITCYTVPSGTPSVNKRINSFTVQNIPIQLWVNFTISVYGKTLDTYINGKLVQTNILDGTPYINNDLDVIVTPDGGFDGSTAKFSYYPNSLNPEQAWNIYEDGYSGGILSNLTGSYQLNISVLQNGIEETSLTI